MPINALPQFTTIDIDRFAVKFDNLLNKNLAQIETLLKQSTRLNWDNLMLTLEDMDDAIERFWSPFAHLHAVMNSPQRRDCYKVCLTKLSAYESALGHNHALYIAIKQLDRSKLNQTQRKIIKDTLRNFELSGVALSNEKKHRFEAIQERLSSLSNQFENNVLDASQAYQLNITDPKRLTGLPEHALHHAQALAEEKGLEGSVFNLEIPCYLAVMTYADDRDLRKEMYNAYITRASDQGPSAGQFDNSIIMNDVLALRHEKANLLGFKNYAELSIVTKMAKSTDEIIQFLSNLSHRAYQQALNEIESLKKFAREEYDIDDMAPWDIAYLSEKKKEVTHAISEEELRAFFPLPKVIQGLFKIIHRLYGINFVEITTFDKWHPDVTCYAIKDSQHTTRGYIYMDLFARQNKRGGAWMDSCQSRRQLSNGTIQLPIATLTCNFTKAVANKPATLSHDEVQTLFHEIGHCLHHVLTKVDYLSASGIHGVEWDAVELPSQFFENWCWEWQALQWLTAHVKHDQPLPQILFKKLRAAKNFQSAMAMMRQLEFSLFDFRIHRDYQTSQPDFIEKILAEVRQTTTVVPIASYNRFQHSFTHIFSGGYAAGYYSYKWAEVLSSDAFSRFEEEGIFNEKAGRDFLEQILEVGSSKTAAEAFQHFRGRNPSADALLKHNGIQ